MAAAATVTTYYSSNAVLIQKGNLTGSGTIKTSLTNTGGTINPGTAAAAGTFKVTGSYNQTAAGKLILDLGRSSADRIAVSGTVVFGGALQMNSGVSPALGTRFTTITGASFSWKARCYYTSGTGSTTAMWKPIASAKALVVERRSGRDTTC